MPKLDGFPPCPQTDGDKVRGRLSDEEGKFYSSAEYTVSDEEDRECQVGKTMKEINLREQVAGVYPIRCFRNRRHVLSQTEQRKVITPINLIS